MGLTESRSRRPRAAALNRTGKDHPEAAKDTNTIAAYRRIGVEELRDWYPLFLRQCVENGLPVVYGVSQLRPCT